MGAVPAPVTGHRRPELTTPVLTRLRAELTHAGVGDATVLKAFTMLQSVLSHAVVEGHVDHNAARAVRKPRQRRERKIDPVAPEVVERMRKDFLDRGDRRLGARYLPDRLWGCAR